MARPDKAVKALRVGRVRGRGRLFRRGRRRRGNPARVSSPFMAGGVKPSLYRIHIQIPEWNVKDDRRITFNCRWKKPFSQAGVKGGATQQDSCRRVSLSVFMLLFVEFEKGCGRGGSTKPVDLLNSYTGFCFSSATVRGSFLRFS